MLSTPDIFFIVSSSQDLFCPTSDVAISLFPGSWAMIVALFSRESAMKSEAGTTNAYSPSILRAVSITVLLPLEPSPYRKNMSSSGFLPRSIYPKIFWMYLHISTSPSIIWIKNLVQRLYLYHADRL